MTTNPNNNNHKTHRDFFNEISGNITHHKWKSIHAKCHPDLTLHGGTSAAWKEQKKVLQTIRELYAGSRNVEDMDEQERANLGEYSDNLDLLFITDPCEFDFRNLADVECILALGNFAQVLGIPNPPTTFTALKECIREYGEAQRALTSDEVGEMETPQREALYLHLHQGEMEGVSRTDLFDALVGKEVANATILSSKRKREDESPTDEPVMTVEPTPSRLERANLHVMTTGMLKFLSSLKSEGVEASRKDMMTSLEGNLVTDLKGLANEGIAFSNTFLTDDPDSVKSPASELKPGQIIVIRCGSKLRDSNVVYFYQVLHPSIDVPDRLTLSAINEVIDFPRTLVIDNSKESNLWVRTLHSAGGAYQIGLETSVMVLEPVFSSPLISRRQQPMAPATHARAQQPSAVHQQPMAPAPPAPAIHAGAHQPSAVLTGAQQPLTALGFGRVERARESSNRESSNTVDLTHSAAADAPTTKTVAEADREKLLAPFKILVNDEARVKTLLPVSKVTESLAVYNVLNELPVDLLDYKFANPKYVPALLQLLVAPSNVVDDKGLAIRLFTRTGKEFQSVSQLRSAIEILASVFDYLISHGGNEQFMRTLWTPWLNKLSRMFDNNFCDLNVLFLEKEVQKTLGMMATALRKPNLDEQDREIVKAILAEAMSLNESSIMQRGMFETLNKGRGSGGGQTPKPPLPPKPSFKASHHNGSYRGGNNQNQGSSATTSRPPCISQMMHTFLGQPPCARSSCNFDHNVKSFTKDKLMQSASQAKGHLAQKLIEHCKNLQG
jgi:hypothetical protein